MKAVFISRSFSPWLLTLAIGLLVTGCSSTQQSATQNSGGQSAPRELTGSYLKQDVSKNGEFTNGKDNVRLLERDKIDRSGASDVNQFLKTQGVR